MESWSTVHARRADRAACTSAGMPGNGYSGRANNLEVLTDPYGGYDVPGPYGVVICGMSPNVLCYRIAGAAAFSGCLLMLTRGTLQATRMTPTMVTGRSDRLAA